MPAQIIDGQPRFVIDGAAYAVVHCRYCGRNIAFVPTANGRRMPTNADGSSHFATCPEYQRRRQIRRKHRPMTQPGLFDEVNND